MRHSAYIIVTLFITFLVSTLAGCGGHDSEAWNSMDVAETIIEERPDTAFAILKSIDTLSLGGKEEKARYALLMSMALDKNYIDTTDFKVLQPAIDYYLRKGTPDEKLRTYYYQGRIYENHKDYDKAMESYILGTDLEKEITDYLTLARTYFSKSIIYMFLYDLQSHYRSCLKAATLFEKKGKEDSRLNSLMAALDGSILDHNRSLADSIYAVCDSLATEDYRQKLYWYKLEYANIFENDTVIRALLKQTDASLVTDNHEILQLANSYQTSGDYVTALELLDRVESSNLTIDSLKYYSIHYLTSKGLGHLEEALKDYEKFNFLINDQLVMTYEQKLNSSEFRHKLDLQIKKDQERIHTTIWVSVCFFLISVIAIGWLGYHNRRLRFKEKEIRLISENLHLRIRQLEQEKEELSSITRTDELPDEIADTIREQIEMLNAILAEKITDNEKHLNAYTKWIEDLTADRERFMNSTRLAFKASHPKFIEYLESHDLTESEINYLCLYAIGLRGKEVGEYIRLKRHYNISSEIRRKLGIDEHETNLGIYVRKLLKQL